MSSTDDGKAKAQEYAELAIRMCKDLCKIDLDYTLDSLETVDRVIEAFRGLRGVSEQKVMTGVVYIGCYIGEVIVRQANGKWKDDVDGNGLPTGLVVGKVSLDPIVKALKRFKLGDEHAIRHYVMCAVALAGAVE